MKRPADFTEYPDAIMSNFDREIDYKVAEQIKSKPFFSQYSAWNFCGYVWWQNEKWHCEIWTHHAIRETISADTLPEIMNEACSKYGDD